MTHDDQIDEEDENDRSALNTLSIGELADRLLKDMADGRRELRQDMDDMEMRLHKRIDGVERSVGVVELKVDALTTRVDVLNRKVDRYYKEFVDGFHNHEIRLQVLETH